jgi:hypothetical protein
MIFAEGTDPEEQSLPGNMEILRDDNRIKHIRVKGSLGETLSAVNEMDAKY